MLINGRLLQVCQQVFEGFGVVNGNPLKLVRPQFLQDRQGCTLFDKFGP
jgi:hypothetical protein